MKVFYDMMRKYKESVSLLQNKKNYFFVLIFTGAIYREFLLVYIRHDCLFCFFLAYFPLTTSEMELDHYCQKLNYKLRYEPSNE